APHPVRCVGAIGAGHAGRLPRGEPCRRSVLPNAVGLHGSTVVGDSNSQGETMSELRALALDDPWQVKAEDFPETGIDKAKLLFLTNYAVLATSRLSVQPWRFRMTDDSMDFFDDRSHLLPVAAAAGREVTVSCVAALLNLRVAARAFGHDL